MNQVSERLKQAMALRNKRQAELARETGIGKSSICTYLSGEYEPKQLNTYKLAAALGVNPAWLMGQDAPMEPEAAPVLPHPDLLPVRKRRIPLLGNIAAGEPIRAEQEYGTYVEADEDVHSDYALHVNGDSMEPTVRRGDLVFIRQQEDVDDGEIAAVLIDESATLKRIYHIKNGLTITSDNCKYPPRTVTYPEHDAIRILGKAVAFKRLL